MGAGNRIVQPLEGGLIAYWDFNTAVGSDVIDLSGHRIVGRMIGHTNPDSSM